MNIATSSSTVATYGTPSLKRKADTLAEETETESVRVFLSIFNTNQINVICTQEVENEKIPEAFRQANALHIEGADNPVFEVNVPIFRVVFVTEYIGWDYSESAYGKFHVPQNVRHSIREKCEFYNWAKWIRFIHSFCILNYCIMQHIYILQVNLQQQQLFNYAQVQLPEKLVEETRKCMHQYLKCIVFIAECQIE